MLYRDPTGQDVYIKQRKPSFTLAYTDPNTLHVTKRTSSTLLHRKTSFTEQYRILELEAQCQDLEMKLAEYEVCEWFLLHIA